MLKEREWGSSRVGLRKERQYIRVGPSWVLEEGGWCKMANFNTKNNKKEKCGNKKGKRVNTNLLTKEFQFGPNLDPGFATFSASR